MGIQCVTEPFFFAWAGARRKLIMALEKKSGPCNFHLFRPAGKLIIAFRKKKLPPKIIFTWFGADRKLIMAKRKKKRLSHFAGGWPGGRVGGRTVISNSEYYEQG